MSTQHSSDVFEEKLDISLKELQECQQQHGLESCYSCEKSIGCHIRAQYVRTVYESMSKGETGGFDF